MDDDAIIKIVNGERNSEAYLISQEYTYEALTNLITEMGSARAPPFDVEFIETFGDEGKYDIYVGTKDLMGPNEVLSNMINNIKKKSIKITVHSTSEQDEFGGGGKYNKTYKKRSKSKSRKRNTRKRNTRKRNTRKRNTRKRNTRK